MSAMSSSALTRREEQIIQYVAEGLSGKMIAHLLSISENTVKNHMTSTRGKLGAMNSAHAVALYLRNGGKPVGGFTKFLDRLKKGGVRC